MDLRPCSIKYLDFHHTAGHEKNTEVIRQEHMTNPKKLYGDIGYNSVIEMNGTIGVGRDVKYCGAHDIGKVPGETYNMNCVSYSISCIGNFEYDIMSEVQYQSLLKETVRVAKLYNIPVERFRRHKDQFATACPGNNFPWARLMANAKMQLEGNNSIVDNDPDVNLLVWVRASKASAVVQQIIGMGYACQQLPIPLSKISK